VNIGYDLGGKTLTSITSYTNRDILVVRDAGALTSSINVGSFGFPIAVAELPQPLNDATKAKVLTQELRLAGNAPRLQWLVGGFYSHINRHYGQDLSVKGFDAITGVHTQGLRAPKESLFWSDLRYKFSQYALFGEGTYSVTDQLDLTGG